MSEAEPPSAPPPRRPEPRQRNEARSWLIVIALALVVGYLIWVILVTLLIGVLVGWLARLYGRRRRRAQTPDR